MRQVSQRKIGLMTATASIALLFIVLSAVALWLVARQQGDIETRAGRIYEVAMPKTFEATRVVRGLERLARDGEAILWVATAEERAERRLRLQRVGDDSALQGTSDIRDMVATSLTVVDDNLALLGAQGQAARAATLARWDPVAQALLNMGVQLGAEAVDSALAESDAIIDATQAARNSLMAAAAIIGFALLLAIALTYFVFARPLKRLAASLRMAGEGHAMDAGSEAIRELQVLHDSAVALARSHRDLAAMRGQLDRLAHTDDLTGLANRRMFQERAAQMLELGKRYGDPCSIIVFDLDHFKSVNDRFGHEGGDLVLRTLGAYILGIARNVDLVARVGGEEFIVLLPQTSQAAALLLADKLLRSLQQSKVPLGRDLEISITASLGVGTLPAGHEGNVAALYAAADNALYEAKHLGRNRVEKTEPDGSLTASDFQRMRRN